MTMIDFTPTSTNNHDRPATIAEQHRKAHEAPPARIRRIDRWTRLRPWLVGTVAGLLIGGAAAFAVSYQTMPVQATRIERVFVDIGGRRAFIVSADVVFDSTPLPPTPAAGQP